MFPKSPCCLFSLIEVHPLYSKYPWESLILFLWYEIRHNLYGEHTTSAYTVKPVLSGHSKLDKTNVLKTNGSLMKVESIPGLVALMVKRLPTLPYSVVFQMLFSFGIEDFIVEH